MLHRMSWICSLLRTRHCGAGSKRNCLGTQSTVTCRSMLSVKHVTPLKSEKDEDGLIIPFYFRPMIFHVHFVTGPRVQLIPPRGSRPLRPELPLRRCGLRCGDVLTAPLQAVPVRFAKICIAEMHVLAFTLVFFFTKIPQIVGIVGEVCEQTNPSNRVVLGGGGYREDLCGHHSHGRCHDVGRS